MINSIKRQISIESYIKQGKVLIIYGARQIGKTTLVSNFLKEYKGKYKLYTGDSLTVQEIFSSQRLERLEEYLQNLDLLVIDEAQNIKNIGQNLKLIIDNLPKLSVIVTGSSSFELAGQIGEPLMGRNIILNLFAISESEIRQSTYFDIFTHLDYSLRFGRYPEVVILENTSDKIDKIINLTESFLLKDIFKFENLKKPELLLLILKLLSYQIGSEVNVNEIATKLGVNYRTVERYIDLLEQSFVIFKLTSYNNNLRNEIKKKYKIYFYDLGIRNALINNFSAIQDRNDKGALFENFLILERLKNNAYSKTHKQIFFWRDVQAGEIDYIEIYDGNLDIFEFTFSPNNKKTIPKAFADKYKTGNLKVINSENYRDFIIS